MAPARRQEYRLFRLPPLAMRNVAHARSRSLIAIAGIGFATVMVLLQLGFLQAVKVTASVNYDRLNFDVALVSPEFEQFYDPGSFPPERLRQADALAEVATAWPFYARMGQWRCPPYPVTAEAAARTPPTQDALARWWLGKKRPRPLQVRDLLVVAIDLDRDPFRDPIHAEVNAARGRLREPDRLLMNAQSNPDFGWNDRDAFSGWELNGQAVDVVGSFNLQRSFGADAAVLCSSQNFARFFHYAGEAPVNFGLLTLRPGSSTADVVGRLNALLPPDVKALSRSELMGIEQTYWVDQTATGKIFGFGVLVTIVVAAVVVYQVLSNDVRDHISEYATLKAMGYTNLYLARVVLTQATIYTTAAYFPAVAVGYALYVVTDTLANIPMVMTVNNLVLVFVLNLVAAIISGLLTLRKVQRAEPADLY